MTEILHHNKQQGLLDGYFSAALVNCVKKLLLGMTEFFLASLNKTMLLKRVSLDVIWEITRGIL